MAYADYEFYTDTYFGNAVPESDFNRLAERASDFIDAITFGRFVGGLPSPEDFVKKIGKAVCAVADNMYMQELAEQAALDAVKGSGSSTETSGGSMGAIKSKSAGSESISYETDTEKASTAKTWSAALSAAGDQEATNRLLYETARLYLMGVMTDDGIPVLFAGA